MATQISTHVRGEKITLFAQKAACWDRRKTLILADLLWDRPEAKGGGPELAIREELQLISEMVQETGSERLVILGDVLGGMEVLAPAREEQIAAWRQRLNIPILSIRAEGPVKAGQIPHDWGMEWIEGFLLDEPFCFRHEPFVQSEYFSWCGHIHPVLNFGRAKGRMRLPCFWIGKEIGILPSFGAFSGGFPIEPGRSDQIYVIAEREILAVPP